MKTRNLFCLLGILLGAPALRADSPLEIATTNENTLNDLFHRVPAFSPIYDKPQRQISALQEQLYLFERKMRGEGLPPDLEQHFSRNYGAIIHALVDDRISEEQGRELFSIHRQLIDHTHVWMTKRVRNENYPAELALNLDYFNEELERSAIPLFEVATEMRTPVINGYQVWVGELLALGRCSGILAPGDIERIRVKADELERFECYFKADGVLQNYERELLHERFLHLTRETIAVVSR